ncbi:hypothetical protein EV421DRAFT_1721825, partial [Armillaria borealis]
HTQLRNVIKRIFGVAKHCFRPMIVAPKYSIATQAKFIPALAALHNFIRDHDPDDKAQDLGEADEEDPIPCQRSPSNATLRPNHVVNMNITNKERDRASAHRDHIAMKMWDNYQMYIRDFVFDDSFDSE